MKNCVPCGASCADAVPTCGLCGEGTFALVAVVDAGPVETQVSIDSAYEPDPIVEPAVEQPIDEEVAPTEPATIGDAVALAPVAAPQRAPRRRNPPPAPASPALPN